MVWFGQTIYQEMMQSGEQEWNLEPLNAYRSISLVS